MTALSLTTYEKVRRYLSSHGIQSFVGDEQETVNDEIEVTGADIMGKISQRYTIAQAAQSPMIEGFAKLITSRNLCTNRGNPIPESLELRYQEIMGDGGKLDKIGMGKTKLVDANGDLIRGRVGYAPGMSNLRVDRWRHNEQIRVVQGSSTRNDTTALEKDNDDYGGGNYDG
jgi:hypothetical protein